jgi:hypothetical protein
MKEKVEKSAIESIAKKDKIVNFIKNQQWVILCLAN